MQSGQTDAGDSRRHFDDMDRKALLDALEVARRARAQGA
jgi:hypothetical protein